MKTIEAKIACKLCGKEIIAQADAACPLEFTDIFAKWLCCNRCYDFHEASEKCGTRIVNTCQTLISLRLYRQVTAEREKQLAEALTWLTKSFCRAAANYYSLPNVWHQEFVSVLMDKPEKAGLALGMIERDLKRQSRAAETRPTTADP